MEILVYTLLVILGSALGSFAGAMVWRLRAKQLVEDKTQGEAVDKKEYKALLPLTKKSFTDDRSRCLHCGHELAWYDLIPLISWIGVAGKCRYCRSRIGVFEPLMEIGVAGFFIGSFFLWPHSLASSADIALFVSWLASGVLLAILFAYDLKWFLLPDRVTFPLIGISAVVAGLRLLGAGDILSELVNIGVAIVILSGLYLLLWLVSKGRWIGFGDIKLGLALALLLGDWQLALLTLFLSNFIGSVIVLPGLLSGKMTRTSHVPFGPLLIIGFLISALLGHSILQWYFTIFL